MLVLYWLESTLEPGLSRSTYADASHVSYRIRNATLKWVRLKTPAQNTDLAPLCRWRIDADGGRVFL